MATDKVKQTIRVSCRIRPLIKSLDLIPETESSGHQRYADRMPSCVEVSKEHKQVAFSIVKGSVIDSECFGSFSALYTPSDSNDALFTNEVVPLIDNGVLNGYNASLLLYGPTGSGKTHSAIGSDNEPGLIPLAIGYCLSQLRAMDAASDSALDVASDAVSKSYASKSQTSDASSKLWMSALEVYNERVFDLSADSKCNEVKIFIGKNGRTVVKDLRQQPIDSWHAFAQWFARVSERRKQAHTRLNAHSSRSHLVLKITARMRCPMHSTAITSTIVHSKTSHQSSTGKRKRSSLSASAAFPPPKKRMRTSLSHSSTSGSSWKPQRMATLWEDSGADESESNPKRKGLKTGVMLSKKKRAPQWCWKRGSLTIVDLAGSENANKSGRRLSGGKAAATESGAINASLFVLSSCIEALKQRRKRVPYRDSKLTRLLTDCLGGNSISSLICCISPSVRHAWQTRHALSFATNTRTIENRVQQNIEQIQEPKPKAKAKATLKRRDGIGRKRPVPKKQMAERRTDTKLMAKKKPAVKSRRKPVWNSEASAIGSVESETERQREVDSSIAKKTDTDTSMEMDSNIGTEQMQTPKASASRGSLSVAKTNTGMTPVTKVVPETAETRREYHRDKYGLPPPLTPASNRTIVKLYLKQAKQLSANGDLREAHAMYDFTVVSFLAAPGFETTRDKVEAKMQRLRDKLQAAVDCADEVVMVTSDLSFSDCGTQLDTRRLMATPMTARRAVSVKPVLATITEDVNGELSFVSVAGASSESSAAEEDESWRPPTKWRGTSAKNKKTAESHLPFVFDEGTDFDKETSLKRKPKKRKTQKTKMQKTKRSTDRSAIEQENGSKGRKGRKRRRERSPQATDEFLKEKSEALPKRILRKQRRISRLSMASTLADAESEAEFEAGYSMARALRGPKKSNAEIARVAVAKKRRAKRRKLGRVLKEVSVGDSHSSANALTEKTGAIVDATVCHTLDTVAMDTSDSGDTVISSENATAVSMSAETDTCAPSVSSCLLAAINEWTEKKLQTLACVGKKRAVQLRTQRPFESVDQVLDCLQLGAKRSATFVAKNETLMQSASGQS